MCTGTLVHHEQTVMGRVARPGRRMRRKCTGTLVHYEQTVMGRVVTALPRIFMRTTLGPCFAMSTSPM